MKNVYRKLMVLALLVIHATPLVAGDENVTPIQKYLDTSTAVVAWIDVNETDFDGLRDFALKHDIPVEPMTEVKKLQQVLKTLKLQRVYILGSLQEITSGIPLIVLPCTPENVDGVEVVASTTFDSKPIAVTKDGSNVLIGSDAVVDRYSKSKSGEAPVQLLAEIGKAEYSSAAILRVPAAQSVLLSPLLPNLLDGVKATPDEVATMTKGLLSLQTVSVSSSVPPTEGRLNLILNSEADAKVFASTLNELIRRTAPETADGLQFTSTKNEVVHHSENSKQIMVTMKCVAQLLTPARLSAQQTQKLNSLKQIALAMHNFYDVYGYFPPQALSSDDGKKLLSWRVLILPFLDQVELYQKFRLDEPWDSEHNIKLAAEIPFAYSGSRDAAKNTDGKTRMQVPLHKQSVFGRKGGGTSFRDITDGTSNTLMVVQVTESKAVVWTKPEDLVIDATDIKASVIAQGSDKFLACLCDGSARALSSKNSNETLLKLITMNGGEIIGKMVDELE